MRRASEGWTLIAVVVAAIGLWLSSGAMAFVSGDVHGTRVGVLPSPWWLVAALAISALAAIALHLLGQPATALWLAAVLIVPWLPVPLPAAAFIWSGPLRMWIAALIVFAALAPIVAASARSGRLVVLMDPRRAPRIAAAIAAVLYVVTAWRIMPRLPGGDEPHYLMIAESLLRDGDLKIENNHLRGDYRDFVDVPLKPDYLRRGTNGEIYSIHAPGLPAVVAPVFALFGYPGVLVFLALVSAAATGVAWSTVWRITGDAAAGWFGWATVALSLPYLFQSFTAYPDGLGGALVMFGVFIAILGSGGSTRLLIAASAALALLPWLHTRFALTACALAVVIAARQWDAPDRLRRLVAFATIPLVGAVAWFGFFYVIYGTPNPAAPYNGNTQSGLGNIPRGVTGLLFDQQFGLLANAPVYACAVAGFLPLGRRHPRIAAELAFVIVPYTLAAAAFYMWWGGFSAPARFISSILLPLSIPAGAWFATRGTAAKICAIGVLAISVLFTVTTAVVDRGALLYNVRDGSSLLLSWLVPMVDVPTGMPSLFQTGAVQAAIRAVVWLLAFAAAAGLVATIVARTRVTRAVIPIAAAFAAAAAAMLALSVVWRLNAAQPLTQGEAGPAVLRAIDGDARQIALQYRPFARLRAGAVPPLLPLLAPPVATPRADPPLASVSDAPAATYTIEATLTGDARRIGAGLDLLPAPMWTWDVSGIRGPWRETVTLPNDAHVFRVDADAPSGAVQNLSIRAERRLASHERVTNRPGWRAARYGRATVFLLDGRAWIETGGSWIVGASYAEFAVVRDSGAPLQLFVRNAAVENIVTLDADAWHETLTLKPREERTLTIPIVPQRPGVVLRVAASTGTRPADVEEGNRDKRFLGCWIETR
jgi:hypothetical protein